MRTELSGVATVATYPQGYAPRFPQHPRRFGWSAGASPATVTATHRASGHAALASLIFAPTKQPHAVHTPRSCFSHARHDSHRAVIASSGARSRPSAAFATPTAPRARSPIPFV